MELYNSLSNKLENYRPDGEIKLYTCGITPYDTTHLGHAFTYIIIDVLIRFFEFKGYRVNYVQNVTDIDDDILARASEEREDWWSLGNHWTREYIRDMKKLNVRPPNHFPRATEVIPEIIDSVGKLLRNGLAYQVKDNVYYSVDSWPKYGNLSRISRDEMLHVANQRGNQPDDPNKISSLDFVLWQARQNNEPAWKSPWGDGRPGWHIECSTIVTKLLGNKIHIHAGGEDLIFPHHECEIAQVEPLSGDEPFVRFWMHVAMVHHEGKKMSKSLGNLILIKNLLKSWNADAIRIYLLMHHYRNPWSHQTKELQRAASLTTQIRSAVSVKSGYKAKLESNSFQNSFTHALENDLDTPLAVEIIAKMTKRILAASKSGRDILDAQKALRICSKILGLRIDTEEPEPDVITGWNAHLEKFTEPKQSVQPPSSVISHL